MYKAQNFLVGLKPIEQRNVEKNAKELEGLVKQATGLDAGNALTELKDNTVRAKDLKLMSDIVAVMTGSQGSVTPVEREAAQGILKTFKTALDNQANFDNERRVIVSTVPYEETVEKINELSQKLGWGAK